MAPIVVPVGIVSLIILTLSSLVLYKRRKLYGGFYLLSHPPLPDFMLMIDENENIQKKIEKLPFILEWEFPRERIRFGKYYYNKNSSTSITLITLYLLLEKKPIYVWLWHPKTSSWRNKPNLKASETFCKSLQLVLPIVPQVLFQSFAK